MDLNESSQALYHLGVFFAVWLSFCVLVLGVAQDVGVFDSVSVLQLLSAGWRCVLAPAL